MKDNFKNKNGGFIEFIVFVIIVVLIIKYFNPTVGDVLYWIWAQLKSVF